jgi:uncharacterized protein YoxC
MAGNTVNLEFAGDAKSLLKASKQSSGAMDDFAKTVTTAGNDMEKGSKDADNYGDRVGKLGAAVDGASTAIDDAGAAVQAMADLQQAGVEKAAKLARANNDVRQATEDYSQALRDSKQATIDANQAGVDLEQARLDQKVAQEDYNKAVKEHGVASNEARQASIDLKQAGIDVTQAQEDSAQAIRDGSQASIDAEAATLDLAEAQREAKPPELQGWADKINMITPLLSGLVGIVGLITAAQWLWNTSLLASPVTWIVLGIGVLIGAIILLVKNWDKVKRAGAQAWDWIMQKAQATWNWIKKIPGWIGSTFKNIAKFLTAPFRTAFNGIADLWNNTVGRLSWSVPGWVPGIGGNSISVPNIPRFHTGGVVPGAPGQEQLAILTGQERVSTPGQGDAGGWVVIRGDAVMDALIAAIASRVASKGGRAAQLGVRFA